MSLDRTSICNQALVRIGEFRILDINDKKNESSRVCNEVFDQTIRAISRMAKWKCIRERTSLARQTETPAFGWDYQFTLPTDFIRAVKINNTDAWDVDDFYEIEGDKILCNADTVQLVYNKFELDSTKYDDLFIEALSTLLAAKIAPSLSGDEGLAANIMQEFKRDRLPEARRIDASEGTKRRVNRQYQESTFVQARRGIGLNNH